MENKKDNIKHSLLILLLCTILILTILFFSGVFDNLLLSNSYQHKYLNSIEIVGYNLDKPFSEDVYEYNLVVTEDEVEIKCDTTLELSGCNEIIDLKNKDEYIHNIVIKKNEEEQIYSINIIKEKKSNVKIVDVDGIPNEWINQDITITVKASSTSDIVSFSFDGGKTWQSENSKVVSQNEVLNIVVKDSLGNISNTKIVSINKIDKEKPKAQFYIASANSSEVVLKAVVSDGQSGIFGISFNNGNYSLENTYKVLKEGTYFINVKDKAGNITDQINLVVKPEDFEKKLEKLIATFEANGATIDSDIATCTVNNNNCKITFPEIKREGYTIIGWSKNKDSKKAEYKVGETISIKEDTKYYAITKKILTATFEANGADFVGNNSLSCEVYNNSESCSITVPKINRDNWIVIGWNKNKNAKTSSVNENTSLQIYDNEKYYAITRKILTATFEANGADFISASNLKCNIYNKENSCYIDTPKITRNEGTVIGWSENKDSDTASIGENTSLQIYDNKKYYAITRKILTAIFEANGANSITYKEASCEIKNSKKSCDIKTPEIKRFNGAKKLGWNENKDAHDATYGENAVVNISNNKKYYAITSLNIIAYFMSSNKVDSIGAEELKCELYNAEKGCYVKAPTITKKNATIVGWNTHRNATEAIAKPGDNLFVEPINPDFNYNEYYPITKQTFTVTLDTNGATCQTKKLTCESYNNSSCSVILPKFSKSGAYDVSWSKVKNESDSSKRYLFGTKYLVNSDITLYANFNHPYYNGTEEKNYLKERNFKIIDSKTVGQSIFEYQENIPSSEITIHKNFLDLAYSKMSFLFVPGKTFVMNKDTYSSYSSHYGLTHYSGKYYFIDIQHDGSKISANATLHELAHAWDRYYSEKTGKGRISNQQDFIDFCDSISGKLSIDSKIEIFAAMVTNYYWHILNMKDSVEYYAKEGLGYYAIKDETPLTDTEKSTLKRLIEKYISISNNGYK